MTVLGQGEYIEKLSKSAVHQLLTRATSTMANINPTVTVTELGPWFDNIHLFSNHKSMVDLLAEFDYDPHRPKYDLIYVHHPWLRKDTVSKLLKSLTEHGKLIFISCEWVTMDPNHFYWQTWKNECEQIKKQRSLEWYPTIGSLASMAEELGFIPETEMRPLPHKFKQAVDVSGMVIGPLTEALKWSKEKVTVFSAHMQRELSDFSFLFYM